MTTPDPLPVRDWNQPGPIEEQDNEQAMVETVKLLSEHCRELIHDLPSHFRGRAWRMLLRILRSDSV